jgi:outer membrane protein
MRAPRRLAFVAASLAGLALASQAAAQEQRSASSAIAPTRSMSLAQAITYARAHQPAIVAGIARVSAREREADVPRAQWQPTIGATAQLVGATANNTTTVFASPSFLDLPRIGATRAVAVGTWQPYASTLVGAGARQELFDFGRIAAQTAAADALVDVQKQVSANAMLDVTYGVEEAYFAVYAAKAVLKAAEDAYERSRVHRDLAKTGVDSGMRSPIELTRAEADLARFDIGRIRASGGLTEAQTDLAAAVGVPDAALDASGTAAAPADLPSINDAIAQANARDPRILQALAQLHADERRTVAIGAEQRPNLALSGSISGRAGGADPSSGVGASGGGWLPNVPNWDVGAVFSWPLFDPVVRAREDASRATEEVRRDELAETRFEQVAAIRRAYVSVLVARDALPGLERAVDAAIANYAQADARFKAGMGTSVELADAEALRADSEIQLALGVFAVARSRAAFGRLISEGN